jgi:hypothetical protein
MDIDRVVGNTELNTDPKEVSWLSLLMTKSGNLAPRGGVNRYSGAECVVPRCSAWLFLANLADLAKDLS